jgi:hypothetical protein
MFCKADFPSGAIFYSSRAAKLLVANMNKKPTFDCLIKRQAKAGF